MRVWATTLAVLATGALLWSGHGAGAARDRSERPDRPNIPPEGYAAAADAHERAVDPRNRFRASIELRLFVVRPGSDEVIEWLDGTPAPNGVAVHGAWGARPLAPIALPDLIDALRGSGVRALDLNHHCRVGVGEFALLAELPELEWLSVSCSVGGDRLSVLGSLSRLRYLGLFGRGLRNDLAPLRSLSNLETLDLNLNLVGDEGARHLAALPALERLHLWRSELTEEGFRALVAAPRLRHLEIGGGYIESEALVGLAGHPTLESIEFDRQDDFTPATMAHLRLLPALEHLEFDYCGREWPPGVYRELGQLVGLRSLTLRHTEIPDAGLAELRGMRHLELLDLVEPAITDAGMEHLAAFPNLRSLTLWDAAITDEGMRVVSRLGRLTELALIGRSDVTDAGLAFLPAGLVYLSVHGDGIRDADFSRFHRLETLWIWGTGVGDAALASVSGLVTLREIDLGETRVTAAGLEHLAGLPRLEYLDLTHTAAADAIPAWLSQKVPQIDR